VLDAIAIDAWENDPALWQRELPRAASGGNKYSRGHALLVGGYPMTGAARMAARGAARAGAGLTSIAVPEIALPIYAGALTSIMVHPLSRPEDLTQLLGDSRYTALLIGPGAGVNEATRARAHAMLQTHRAVLLDADAISVFADRVDELAAAIHGPCILTPHEGEFVRLFGETAIGATAVSDTASGAAGRGGAAIRAAGGSDKLSRARAAARSSGAIIVLKGSDTVIAAPDGRAIVNSNAPANLATAGSGDVLSGMILGLLAQGMDGFLAAAAGVWLHGAAAADFGPGLLAEDLPDLLPGVLRRLDTKMA
jgi:NAD(P)H-hydrate epimerase